MGNRLTPWMLGLSLAWSAQTAWSEEAPSTGQDPAAAPVASMFDAALAARVGADEHGMRNYVLVILKTGPKRVPDGPERDAMFKGHFANMKRLADAGQLALAGPFGKSEGGWRGLFVLAVEDIDAAKALVATDPVIEQGEMVAEYHPWYGSAALMQINELHPKVAKKSF